MFPDGMNSYEYVRAAPLNRLDTHGLFSAALFWIGGCARGDCFESSCSNSVSTQWSTIEGPLCSFGPIVSAASQDLTDQILEFATGCDSFNEEQRPCKRQGLFAFLRSCPCHGNLAVEEIDDSETGVLDGEVVGSAPGCTVTGWGSYEVTKIIRRKWGECF